MPSFVGHSGFIVSLKLCLNLSKFSLLSPTLNRVEYATPFGLRISYTEFWGGLICEPYFFLKMLTEGDSPISGSSFSIQARSLGKKKT